MPDVTPTRAAATPLGPDEPALMLMTSGTTGRPKGIVLSQAALLARIAHNLAAIPELPLPTLCILSVFFGHGLICNVLTPSLAGSTVYLWPGDRAARPRRLARCTRDRLHEFGQDREETRPPAQVGRARDNRFGTRDRAPARIRTGCLKVSENLDESGVCMGAMQ